MGPCSSKRVIRPAPSGLQVVVWGRNGAMSALVGIGFFLQQGLFCPGQEGKVQFVSSVASAPSSHLLEERLFAWVVVPLSALGSFLSSASMVLCWKTCLWSSKCDDAVCCALPWMQARRKGKCQEIEASCPCSQQPLGPCPACFCVSFFYVEPHPSPPTASAQEQPWARRWGGASVVLRTR